MWRVLRLLGARVVEFEEDFLNVSIHSCTTCALGVVPLEIYTCKFYSFPISSYIVVCLKGGVEVLGVFTPCVLDSKVIHY
jgi:hypothetical protein